MAIHDHNVSLDPYEYLPACPLWRFLPLWVKPSGMVFIRENMFWIYPFGYSCCNLYPFCFALLNGHINANKYFVILYNSGTLKYISLKNYVHSIDLCLFFSFSPRCWITIPSSLLSSEFCNCRLGGFSAG